MFREKDEGERRRERERELERKRKREAALLSIHWSIYQSITPTYLTLLE